MSITAIVFLLGMLAGTLLALARHPIYGLLSYVAVFYVNPPSRWWGGQLFTDRWSLIAALVTVAAVLIHRPQKQVRPLFSHRILLGMVLFVSWLAVQSFWAVNQTLHFELLGLYMKYTVLIGLIYLCLDSERHLRMFLWVHVVGCVYLGVLIYLSYRGGRFEEVGGAGVADANTGAMQLLLGIFAAAGLLLSGRVRSRLSLVGGIPFIVNALVATASRSAFLAAAVGGAIFNLLTPRHFKWPVRVLSVLALILFFLLTNPLYWERINTISYRGADIEGVDTGAGRIALIKAQWRMFERYPMGCGHRCTATLSPGYLDDRYLTGPEGSRARSSHNTFMTLLVEQGIPGAAFYAAFIWWTIYSVLALRRNLGNSAGFLPALFPAVVAALGAIAVGDVFVDYLKLEARFWFLSLLMLMLSMSARRDRSPAAS